MRRTSRSCARTRAMHRSPLPLGHGPAEAPRVRSRWDPSRPDLPMPPATPQTPEEVALGQKLFFEGRLSADGTVTRATCHDPARAFTAGRPASVGINGRTGQRNAPTVLNALNTKAQFWDGRAKTL